MKRLTMTLAAAMMAGCSHTTTVPDQAAERRAQAAEDEKPARPRARPERKTDDGVRVTDEGRKEIPVASSPAGLLKPGADQKIERRLADEGFLRRAGGDADEGAARTTTEALRRFQKHHTLPATGMPDHETIRKLGLDPNDVFKSGEVPPTGQD